MDKNHYLTNKDFYIEIIYSKSTGRLTNKAKVMIELLGKKTLKKFRFFDEDDKKDFYMSGLLDMYDNWMGFDEEKGNNTFAYFTEVFKRGVSKGRLQLYKKKGIPMEESVHLISIQSSNDGMGMHNL